MRADRLVAALLVLQARGRVTAPELAAELEVSVKTARRDLEALAMAGFPVYSTTGRHGGWELLGGARTDLSGLTATEATMLFLVAGPASTATPEAKQALRKLVQALPESFRAEAEAAAAATVFDPAGWGGAAAATVPRFLDELRQAVVTARQVRLDYADRTGAHSTRVVHPLGVVKKGATWYLVADTDRGQRTFRVNRVRAVELLDEPAVRPDGFDLAAAWRDIVEEVEAKRVEVTARLRVRRWSVRWIRDGFGPSVEVDEASASGPAWDDGIEVMVGGPSVAALARQLAPWAEHLIVIDPPELREALVELGAALVAMHGRAPDVRQPSAEGG